MIKDSIQYNENTTPNSRQLAVLKEHFPACFKADGSFDVERFKAEIASTTNVVQEGYELKFLGKSYAKLLASTETTTVIQPNEAHNSLPENANSENIYISGDNLDGLKHLLKSYNGAIKCIYIDPPYNTGSDGFVYADNFNYTKETLQEKLSVSEEEAERILDLTKRGSASHSAWLMFMYSRLLLARDLLKDDGVIFISIDDNEQANLKLLCDDVFGEENYIGAITWLKKRKGSFLSKQLVSLSEYIHVYSRNKANKKTYLFGGVADESESQPIIKRTNQISTLLIPSNIISTKLADGIYPKGGYGDGVNPIELIDDVIFKDGTNVSEFRIKGPFTWSQDYFDNELKKGSKPVINTINFQIRVFRVNDDDSHKGFGSVIDGVKIKGTNEDAYEELESLMGVKNIFDYSKPKNLLKELITAASQFDKSSLVLDFFSGSGTTAHALMHLNAEDGGNRRFVAVQLPETLSPDVDSQKIAYEFLKINNLPTTLDYIGIERIKRAAARIKEEHPDKELDLGFKHYILQEPNQNTLDKLDSFDKASLLADTTIMEEFGKPTILATWLNADGYGLTAQAAAIDLAGYTAYYCQKHLYLIDPGFTLESMKALLSKYDAEGHFNPENMVLFGYSFPDWSINEMIEKNLRILNDGEKNLKINFTVRY